LFCVNEYLFQLELISLARGISMSKTTSLHFEGADFDSLLRQEFLSATDLKSSHASIKRTPVFPPQEKRPQRKTEHHPVRGLRMRGVLPQFQHMYFWHYA
jgi:hypothetical protein